MDVNGKLDAGRLVALTHLAFGGINVAVFGLSGGRMLHMGVLGALALAVGGGLLTQRTRALCLALAFALAPITFIAGASTLSASLGFGGFNPSPQGLLFNLGLLAYATAALVLLYYLIVRGRALIPDRPMTG